MRRTWFASALAAVVAAVVAVGVAIGVAACGADVSLPPEQALAERLWQELQEQPGSGAYDAFVHANLEAARKHGEMHDRLGVQFQVRAHEAQAGQAERLLGHDPQQARRLAFEISDRVDELERRDLLGVYDEALPGSAARFLAARDRARAVVR